MKFIITYLIIILYNTFSYGQVINYSDFKTIIPYLQKEDFKEAFNISSQLLILTENDSSDLRGIVTYMNIFSAAGMVTIDQMTHDDFQKNANKYIGQKVVMSGHPCIDSAAFGYNSLKFITEDGILQGMTVSSNSSNTNILCFEYFKYAEKINQDDFLGKNVRSGGILSSVEVNPNKSKVWISKLHMTNAFIRVMTPR